MIHNAGGIHEFVDWIDFKYRKMVIRSMKELLYDTDTLQTSKQEISCVHSNQDLSKIKSRNLKICTSQYQSWSPNKLTKSTDSKRNSIHMIEKLYDTQLKFSTKS